MSARVTTQVAKVVVVVSARVTTQVAKVVVVVCCHSPPRSREGLVSCCE